MSVPLLSAENGIMNEKGGIENDFMYGSNVAQSNIYVRMGFLRKVYGLLSAQLLLTAVVAGTFAYTPVLRDGIHANGGWIMMLCFPTVMVLMVALHVKRHQVPINFILLTAFTVVEAITVAMIVSLYDAASVVKALALTLIIVAGLTAFTMQSKHDFSFLGIGLFVSLLVLIGLGLMNIFLGSSAIELAIAGGGAVVFSLFIVFDTQMIMTKLSPEEYILATINLYLDAVNLFIHLLRIFGDRK